MNGLRKQQPHTTLKSVFSFQAYFSRLRLWHIIFTFCISGINVPGRIRFCCLSDDEMVSSYFCRQGVDGLHPGKKRDAIFWCWPGHSLQMYTSGVTRFLLPVWKEGILSFHRCGRLRGAMGPFSHGDTTVFLDILCIFNPPGPIAVNLIL